MAYTNTGSGTYDELGSGYGTPREPGARRRKLAGYLKAANELRQSYFTQDPTGTSGTRDGGYESGVEGPGAFPDAAVVRSGNEEMVLFPSYARRHVKSQRRAMAPPPPSQMGQETEEQYWRREWERHQDDSAVVDVDVRGWIYTPHRGPTTRKQRLMIGLARQMVGIPAPTSASSGSGGSSRATSPQRSKQEEDLIAREAENIVKKGEDEARYARRGAFSEAPRRGDYGDSLYDYSPQSNSRASSLDRSRNRLSQASLSSSVDEDATPMPAKSRSSWPQPGKMSQIDLHVANNHLLNRLKPFMANPLANTSITAFFYNESKSRQHTVYTDASGHFTCRAALDFVPTHVRVLAAEKLSATEEVIITSPKGVSLISDIDDTIKHSAISAGAREIFRNAFIRELGDLTIDGVREWYNTMHDMGVKLHYVSNSPWQMYPILTSYFKLAHLPRGSFHLKQYSGMLQGIFEPVAERKKGNIDKIMRDFPDRKFILVGDSGEADLEVYTEAALEHPGRVLGIFIRDVTTPVKTGYFDQSNGTGGRGVRNHRRHRSGDSLSASKRLSRPDDIRNDDADLKAAIAASLADMEEETRKAKRAINPDAPSPERSTSPKTKPSLPPPRRHAAIDRSLTGTPVVASPEEDLIDFTDEPAPKKPWLEPPAPRRSSSLSTNHSNGAVQSKPSPSPPPKPPTLRSPSPNETQHISPTEHPGKTPPPRPRKPSSAVKAPTPQQVEAWTRPSMPTISTTIPQVKPSPLSQVTQQSPETPREKQKPPLPVRKNENSTLYKGFATAHKALVPGTYWQSDAAVGQPRPNAQRAISTASRPSLQDQRASSTSTIKASQQNAPPPPPRLRKLPSYTTTSMRSKTMNRLSGGFDDSSVGGGGGSLPGTPAEAGMSKKEFLWAQRWARAKSVLERQGVVLRSWRVGSDVADVCVRLAEQAIRAAEKEEREMAKKQNGDAGRD